MELTTTEGTWEEIQQYSSQLAGHRLSVTVLDEEDNGKRREPNQKMLQVIQKIRTGQKDMRFTDGSKTQEILREARDRGILGK